MPQQQLHVAKPDREWIERFGWRSADDVLTTAFFDVVAVSRSSDVARVAVDAAIGGPTIVFVKRYLYGKRSQRIKQMFRGTLFGLSRARREYEFLSEMVRRGVPTVRPIAYGERRRGLFLHSSFLITEGAENCRSLDLFYLGRLRDKPFGGTERRAFIKKLAATVRGMHDAGVRHGGLFWRNILVHPQSDGSFCFSVLDPDTRAKLHDSPVPPADVVADLSEIVASAMAVGMRGGLLGFAKAYLDVPRLTAAHRGLVAEVIKRAGIYAGRERARMATVECLEWFRRRVADRRDSSTGIRIIRSLDEYFATLESFDCEANHHGEDGRTIHFSFADGNGTLDRSVKLEGGRFVVGSKFTAKPDLLVRSDSETWLAVLAGRSDAFERVQAGRLLLSGDVRLLLELARPLDEAVAAVAE